MHSTPNTFGSRLRHFLTTFPPAPALPDNATAFNPYQEPAVAALLTQFTEKFYADNHPRVALLGINPGRFGAGRTGVAFTDPATLADLCGIPNTEPHRPELSSQFVYRVVAELGGPTEFYRHFYLGSLYPLVLLRDGKNYNYYDSPALQRALESDIQDSVQRQVAELGLARHAAVCLGRQNGLLFNKLNSKLKLFDRIVVLDHPRYIMQYQRRALADYVASYAEALHHLKIENQG